MALSPLGSSALRRSSDIRAKLATTAATAVYTNSTTYDRTGSLLFVCNTSNATVDVTVAHYVFASLTTYAIYSAYPLFAHETLIVDMSWLKFEPSDELRVTAATGNVIEVLGGTL